MELEYDTNWSAELTSAGITPASNPISIRGVLKALLSGLGGNGIVAGTVSVASNAGTVAVAGPVVNNFTNSSAATMAITIATAGATDGQVKVVRVYDFSAAAETIGWTNTENSGVSAPTTSNGSTTSPKTVTFMFNGATTKWRTIQSV